MNRIANQKGLDLIKVDKQGLLEKLLENRTQHIQEFIESIEGFKIDQVAILKAALKKTKSKMITTSIHWDVPASHEEDYTTIIEMLEMSTDETVYITRNEFQEYVQDKWHWKSSFAASNEKFSTIYAASL